MAIKTRQADRRIQQSTRKQSTRASNGAARGHARASRTSDHDLVAGILAGDDESFGRLYARYQPRVFGFAMRRVHDAVDAEDIAQEVFLQVHRSIGSYQGRASLSTWIFGIAHNVTCRFFRKQGMPTQSLESHEVDTKLAFLPNSERRLDASRAIARCNATLERGRTKDHREIFHQFYGNGRTLRVIAHDMGRPTESVKDSLRRSRNLLLRDVKDLRSTLARVGA